MTRPQLERAIARADRAAGTDDAEFLRALRAEVLGEPPQARAASARGRARGTAARRPGGRASSRTRKLEKDARHLANARALATQVTRGVARILGGTLVKGQSFADCVAVGGNKGWDCTGTLIAPHVVLTAGHCSRVATRVFIGNDVEKKGVVVKVAQRLRHASYTSGHRNDVMLLILEEKVTSVPPRALAAAGAIDKARTGRLVGFGNTDSDGSYGYGAKRLVDVPIASPACSGKVNGQTDAAAYGCYRGLEVVAGKPLLKKDSCSGDSGGPLYVLDAKGNWRLAAVTSRAVDGAAHACGDGGVYVRVDKYREWIRSGIRSKPRAAGKGTRKTAARKR